MVRPINSLSSFWVLVVILVVAGCNTSHHNDASENIAQKEESLKLSPGHEISCLTFSPDGRFLATSNGPELWNLETGAKIPDDHPKSPDGRDYFCMAFSPDGDYLVAVYETAYTDRPRAILQCWRVENENKMHLLWESPCAHYGNPTEAFHIAFSPNGDSIAFGAPDATVHVWESATGEERLKFRGGVAVTYSANGKTLIAVRHDGAIRHYDAATGKPLGDNLRGHDPAFLYVDHASFSTDGRRVAISDGYVVVVKNTLTGANLSRLAFESGGILLSPEGNTLVVHTSEGIAFFEATSVAARGCLVGEMNAIGAIAFSPDSSSVAWVENGHRNFAQGDYFGKDTCVHVRETVSLPLTGQAPPQPLDMPLKAELLIGEGNSVLLLNGKTPDEFSQIAFGDCVRSALQVNWKLRVTNISDQTITIEEPQHYFDNPTCVLFGDGAINRPHGSCQIGVMPHDADKDIRLRPGATHDFPLSRLSSSPNCPYWVMAGDYVVSARMELSVSPPPKPSRWVVGDSGQIKVTAPPVRVTVKAVD